MSKAVLVIDMPESCRKCPAGNSMISDEEDELCACELIFPFLDEVRCVDNYTNNRPDWCPLRQLPEKKQNACKHGFAAGWNACIDAITNKGNS